MPLVGLVPALQPCRSNSLALESLLLSIRPFFTIRLQNYIMFV